MAEIFLVNYAWSDGYTSWGKQVVATCSDETVAGCMVLDLEKSLPEHLREHNGFEVEKLQVIDSYDANDIALIIKSLV